MREPMENASSSCFPTTQWTQLIDMMQRGGRETAQTALNEFCERYRPAIHQFFRRRGCTHEDAEDFTQSFFAGRILSHWEDADSFLHAARPDGQRRFRSFLCHVLWRFLQDEWKKQNTARAGGGARHVPLDQLELAGEPDDLHVSSRFGREFDRVFALQIIHRAAERSPHSRHLLAHLRGEVLQQAAARELGLTENAFKQAYHRFRKRLAQDLWDEVSKLSGPDDHEIRAEIEYLMSLFAESGA
jgi:DNA-directed RNA polymerase specialized sigma24 family protein